MKKSAVLFFAMIYSVMASGFSLDFEFKNGETVCNEMADKMSSEFSKWVQVPIDYKNPQSEKTAIYSYTKKKFNPNLPSLIYFVGGPGSSSRGLEFSLNKTNVIFFEQRGISCSRPKTREIFLNPKFYSSENTAADGLMVLNAFGVKKAAVYGHSYGTVPATIFASKYENRTQALLLEGVVFKADESLWIAPRKVKYIEDFFYSLTKEQQQRITEFTNRNDVPKNWFSFMGRMTLGVGNFQEGFTSFLQSTLFDTTENRAMSDEDVASMFTQMVPHADTTTPAEENGYGEITMGMIACQEMNMANPELSHLLVFRNGHLVPDRNNIERISMCDPLGLADNKGTIFTAEKYPIHVPVTYFLGEYDPATSLDQGLSHFKNANSKIKQALVMPGGGHTPNIETVIEAGNCDPKKETCEEYRQQLLEVNIFEKASMGKLITPIEINEFNSSGKLHWDLIKM